MSTKEAPKVRPPPFELVFIVCGVWLIGLGLYFIFLRPALLPEDLRYIGVTLREIQSAVPGLEHWMHRVFAVMGGFMVGAGILLIHVMTGGLDTPKKRALITTTLAGVSTVGIMSATNFQLDSDFKWLLLIPCLIWAVGLALYWRHRSDRLKHDANHA